MERALRAVEEGRVSVEEILRVAGRDPAVRAALDDLVARASARPSARVQVRRARGYPPETLGKLLEAARATLVGVEGLDQVCWGTRWAGGRPVAERCLVCVVSAKVAEPRTPIPAELALTVGGRVYRVRTDVQQRVGEPLLPGEGKQWAARATWPLPVSGVAEGSVGAEVDRGALGPVVVVSGHVVGGAATVRLSGAQRIVSRCIDDGFIDAASVFVPELTAGSKRVVARDPYGSDVGRHVLLDLQAGPVYAAVDSVGRPARFGSAGWMRDVTLLDRAATRPGDSGSPAYLDGVLIGFVVGLGTPASGLPATTALVGARRCIDAVV